MSTLSTAPVSGPDGREGSTLADRLTDQHAVTDAGVVDGSKAVLEEALSTIPERLADVVRLSYGLRPYMREHSGSEIGEIYGMSKEGCRQLKKRAFKALLSGPYAEKLQEIWPEGTY